MGFLISGLDLIVFCQGYMVGDLFAGSSSLADGDDNSHELFGFPLG